MGDEPTEALQVAIDGETYEYTQATLAKLAA
jgi:hypothetical protein